MYKESLIKFSSFIIRRNNFYQQVYIKKKSKKFWKPINEPKRTKIFSNLYDVYKK